MVNITQADIISVIQQQIIHRFGIPQTIFSYHGTMFIEDKVVAFSQDYVLK